MRGSDFIFDCVHLLYYKCHNINPDSDGLYIDYPVLTKINKKDNKCFQYAVTVTLDHEKIKDPQRLTKIKLFIDKYN